MDIHSHDAMREWYYTQAGAQRGPIRGERLEQLARSGRLLATDLVWREGLAEWVPAGCIKDLLPTPVARKGPPPLPVATTLTAAVDEASPEALPTALPVTRTTDDPVTAELATAELATAELATEPATVEPAVVHSPKEFKDLYDQLLKFSIPVAVVTVIGEAIPGINVLAYLGALVLFLILSSIFLYKAWDLIQDRRARTTPGKAVGFRFIPFYAYYWEFVAVKGLVHDLSAYARRRRIAVRPISQTLAIWYCVMTIISGALGWVPVLGGLLFIPWIVLFLVLMNSVKSACMAIAASQGGPAATPIADRGPGLLAGAGVLGVAGLVQGFSEGMGLVEKMTNATAE